ncbi:MFS transporter [Propionibacteriaceae bacterium G1746]|uniref:MFS transporter n=1 Tax=Aestuariimicrobium sp. G57 TaxID=3418485 RepID=UPI003C1A1D2B
MSSTTTPRTGGMSPLLVAAFAIAGGASVGNLYWAQPLLAVIAETFHIPTASAGTVVTVTQLGYAIGALLIIPSGDIVNRRRVIPVLMSLAAIALLMTGLAPSWPALLAAVAAIGLTTVSGQMLMPLAGDVATPLQRGRVLSIVASGILLGLVLARAISGLLAQWLGWRAVFFVAAGIMVVLAVVMARLLPDLPPRERLTYPTLFVRMLKLLGNPKVRATMVLGVPTMGIFTLFWTALTFLSRARPTTTRSPPSD